MKILLNLILDLFTWLFGRARLLLTIIYEKFLEINVFEKGIVVTVVLAFAAVVAPMAKYMIFDMYFSINNPAAHYMIGIVLLMLVTIYFSGVVSLGLRLVSNLSYLIYIIYLQAAHEISKAPYDLSFGYYLNILCPAVYILLALGSAMADRGR